MTTIARMNAITRYKNKAHRTAHSNGTKAAIAGEPRNPPYGCENRSTLEFRRAWLAGFDETISHRVAKCIGCGCTDIAACFDPISEQPCHWLVVDRSRAEGVCSCCASAMPQWKRAVEA